MPLAFAVCVLEYMCIVMSCRRVVVIYMMVHCGVVMVVNGVQAWLHHIDAIAKQFKFAGPYLSILPRCDFSLKKYDGKNVLISRCTHGVIQNKY